MSTLPTLSTTWSSPRPRWNTWKDGKRHGTQKAWFDRSGKPALEEEWADDVRLSRKEWDESGKVMKDERYNPDGSRK